jgi:hypothetical protein
MRLGALSQTVQRGQGKVFTSSRIRPQAGHHTLVSPAIFLIGSSSTKPRVV